MTTTLPPDHALLPLGSGPLHYRAAGNGPLLVLLHGANGSMRDWTFTHFKALSRDWTVVAFDRPGLGASAPAADASLSAQAKIMRAGLAELARKGRIPAEPPVLCGHSFGGAVALAWALDAPQDVAGLVLLGAPSHVWPGTAGRLTDLINTPILGRLVSYLVPKITSRARLERAVASTFAPQEPPDGYFEHFDPRRSVYPAIFRRNAAQVGALKAQIRAMTPKYPHLTMPMEILHGTQDDIVWASIHSEPLARSVQNGRLTLLEGVGHMPHHVRPEALAAALARLMDNLRAPKDNGQNR